MPRFPHAPSRQRRRALLLAPLCLLLSGAAPPQPELPVSRFQLPNGLEVLIHEDHRVPLVAVSLWYHVGSKDEDKGRTGLAHLFEHMMFQGSKHVGDDMHFKHVQQAGGFLNGTTNTDRTNYFQLVPSNFLERILFLEADRMGFLLDALTSDKLDNQRDVVRNERRQRYEVAPYGLAPKYLAEALYPEDHPYHHLTIGEHRDLQAASLADVRAFFTRYYAPSNAVLVIAGDVDPREARRLVDRWFGPLPRRERPKTVREWPMPTLSADKRIMATDRVTLPRLYVYWHTPARFQPGDAEMELLAAMLGGKSGRLYRRLVYKDQLAQDLEVTQQSHLLSSRFGIVITVKEGKDPAAVLRVLDEELGRLRRDPPRSEELLRAANRIEAELLFELDALGGFHGRAERLQQYLYYTGDPNYLGRDLDRYRRATPEAVRQALLTYLGPGRVVLTVLPAGRAEGRGGALLPEGR